MFLEGLQGYLGQPWPFHGCITFYDNMAYEGKHPKSK